MIILELMGLPVFIKFGVSLMAAVFISNIVQALTGFAGVMLSIPPTILLYGPDMAKCGHQCDLLAGLRIPYG